MLATSALVIALGIMLPDHALPDHAPQDPTPQAPGRDAATRDAAACERFAALPATQKATLLARVRGLLAAEPAAQRIAALRVDYDDLPAAAPTPVFDPAEHAPGVAPARTLIAPDSEAGRKVAARFARVPLLPDLRTEVAYNWCTGRIVAQDVPLEVDAIFANLLRGYAPFTDHAVARVQQALDDDKKVRKLAFWFGHAVADLHANAYPGVTLYDAWYSGEEIGVPDVDAIPYAHAILKRTSLRSPLSGKPRDDLYEAIKDGALAYRKYRTLREAAAAAFVCAEPRMDPMYARLVPRFHYLFARHGDALDAVRDLLGARDRDALVDDIDRRVSEFGGEAFKVREARRAQLAGMQDLARRTALAELELFAPEERVERPEREPR